MIVYIYGGCVYIELLTLENLYPPGRSIFIVYGKLRSHCANEMHYV